MEVGERWRHRLAAEEGMKGEEGRKKRGRKEGKKKEPDLYFYFMEKEIARREKEGAQNVRRAPGKFARSRLLLSSLS